MPATSAGMTELGFAEERGREIKNLPAIERWADFRYIENSPVAQKPRAFSFRAFSFRPARASISGSPADGLIQGAARA